MVVSERMHSLAPASKKRRQQLFISVIINAQKRVTRVLEEQTAGTFAGPRRASVQAAK